MRRRISGGPTLLECRSASCEIEAWPSSSWIARRSAPPSSRCVANEWRRVCGEMPALHRGVPRPDPQAPAHVGGRQPPAGLREEERLVAVTGRERRPRTLQVAPDGAQRRLAGGHDPGLRALALHAQLLGVEADRGDVEVHELLGAQPAGVGDLEQRAVAQLERRRGGDRGPAASRARRGAAPRAASAGASATGSGRPGSGSPGRARAACGRRRAARRACARSSPPPRRGRRARRRSGAAPAIRRPGPTSCSLHHSANCPRSTP